VAISCPEPTRPDPSRRRGPRAVASALCLSVAGMIAAGVPPDGGGAAGAAESTRRFENLPIDLKADHSEMDLKNNVLLFRKITISQGGMTASAEQAEVRGTKLDFDNSQWVFRGNVRMTMDRGVLTSDYAEISFIDKVLAHALATGKPAEFEQPNPKTGKIAKGHADTIDYNVSKDEIRLLKNAYLTDGSNEMHGESLKYDVLDQKIIADVTEQNSQRVHITITPPPKPIPGTAPAAAGTAAKP
jgi:lipopolysaccharide export system protein LptA